MSGKHLYRSESNKFIGGVCGGIAEFFGIDPSIVRIIAVLLSIGSVGTGVLVYIVAWILIPPENNL
ncbi:MAG: PspC domain-containing protein [Oscillospiraceae bacterium]|nr:PspC domain-containing protein [Oscillospiraceae bacterium]